jgi:two-component system chemotaxis response regulator CheY
MSRAVLLIDDDDAIRSSLGEFLEEQGFSVLTACHGAEALELLKKVERPALILLDFMMPVMNGNEFLTAMRGDPALRGIPVVILSAWVREWTGHAIGADHVVGKPFNTDKLVELVGRYCERSNVRAEGKM